nr:TonB-dependent receptor [uncultured Holophaga sp.]
MPPWQHLFCVLCVLCALPLLGQDTGADSLRELQDLLAQPVQTASRRPQMLKEAAADITVLQGRELRLLGYRTLGEALGGVLGFRTNEDRVYEGLGVRGLYLLGDQNTRVQILIDGHALNSLADVGSSKVGFDFGLPLDMVERIEVLRGATSSLYGNNAFLGLVNVITRDAPEEDGHGEVVGTADSRRLLQGSTLVGGTLGPTRWSLVASGVDRGGSRTRFPELSPDELPARLDREHQDSAYLQLKGATWKLAGYFSERRQGTAMAPFDSTLGSTRNSVANRQAFFDARFTPTLGAVELMARAYGDRSEFLTRLDYDGTRVAGWDTPFHESDPNFSLGGELQARLHLGERILATLGHEESRQHFSSDILSGELPIETRVRHQVSSSYLQLEWSLTGNLSATTGLQYSAWEVSRATLALGGDLTRYPESTLEGSTPRLALVWQPSPVDTLKAIYAGGYRCPTTYERYYQDDGSILANPGLKAEHNRTLQGLWIHRWANGLQTQISGTRITWDHLIQATMLSDELQQFRNSGERVEGRSLEAELQGRWGTWTLYAQAGLYRWRQGGRSFPDSSQTESALRVLRRWSRSTLSGECRYVGARENPEAGARVPGALTARLAYHWEGEGWWFRSTLEDLGNAKRRDLVAGDYDPITQMASSGRTLQTSLGLRF